MHQVVIASWREQVPASLAAQADQWQGKIKVAWNTAVLVTGQALRAMKQEMPHGSFESWWREELKLKDRKTVADLMAASEVLEEAPMDSPLVSLPPRTLGILKRGGGKAVSTAAQRMADGERITEAKAKAIVQPAEEAPESKCGDSPQMDVTLPTAEELMARVLNLEAENAQLRDELQAQPAVQADNSVELQEALAKIEQLQARYDFLWEESQQDVEEVEEEIEELRAENARLQGQVKAANDALAPMERRWKALADRTNPLPAPVASPRDWETGQEVLLALNAEARAHGYDSSTNGDRTMPIERYNRYKLLAAWWNSQRKPDGTQVDFTTDELAEFLTLLDDLEPPAATDNTPVIDAPTAVIDV